MATASYTPVLLQQKLKTTSWSTANDSDVTFTVTSGERWIINSIWVEYTSTNDVGNRQLCIEVQTSGADVLYQVRAGAVQAASATRYYLFATSMPDLTSFRDTDWLCTPLPAPLELDPGEKLRVYDKTAVAAAADDLVIHVRYYAQHDV